MIKILFRSSVNNGFAERIFCFNTKSLPAGEDKNFISKFMTKEKQGIFNPALAKDIFSKEEIA